MSTTGARPAGSSETSPAAPPAGPPNRAPIGETKTLVGRSEDLPEGRVIRTIHGRTSVLVVRSGGVVHCVQARCPHQGADLSQGIVQGTSTSSRPGDFQYVRDGEIIRCPWHRWEFDLTNGSCLADPERYRVRAYATHEEDGKVYLGAPLPAVRGTEPESA